VGFRKIIVCSGIALGLVGSAFAQVPPTAAPDQMALLKSDNPKEAANKKLVFDMWRAIIQGGHVEMAEQYFTPGYIQHNPNVATGRAAFIDFFSKLSGPKPIEAQVKAPLVAIVAEGDMVVLSFVREGADPKDPTKKYTTTWFDMFRLEGGKIAEHWDGAQKQ
jgi:predicted SnoaL-like aldol condensation-catalyzing enzyme